MSAYIWIEDTSYFVQTFWSWHLGSWGHFFETRGRLCSLGSRSHKGIGSRIIQGGRLWNVWNVEKLHDPPSNIELVPHTNLLNSFSLRVSRMSSWNPQLRALKVRLSRPASYPKGSQKNISSILIHTTTTPEITEHPIEIQTSLSFLFLELSSIMILVSLRNPPLLRCWDVFSALFKILVNSLVTRTIFHVSLCIHREQNTDQAKWASLFLK